MTALPIRTCEVCPNSLEGMKPGARFCCGKCRVRANKAKWKDEVIRDYLREIGRRGARARRANREAAQAQRVLEI
jgi:hypothetical protein